MTDIKEQCWFCEEIFTDIDSFETHLSEAHQVTLVKKGDDLGEIIDKVLKQKRRVLH